MVRAWVKRAMNVERFSWQIPCSNVICWYSKYKSIWLLILFVWLSHTTYTYLPSVCGSRFMKLCLLARFLLNWIRSWKGTVSPSEMSGLKALTCSLASQRWGVQIKTRINTVYFLQNPGAKTCLIFNQFESTGSALSPLNVQCSW